MSKKRDFTLYQRIRIFLYGYNTFWLELGIQFVGGAIFIIGLVLLPAIFGRETINHYIIFWSLILTFFVWGLVGWVRIIKGERSTKLEIVRSKFALYSGILWVLFNWGCALSLFIALFLFLRVSKFLMPARRKGDQPVAPTGDEFKIYTLHPNNHHRDATRASPTQAHHLNLPKVCRKTRL